MAVQLIPGVILMFGCFLLKESPQFLIKAGKEEEAIKNLTWLRNLPAMNHCELPQSYHISSSLPLTEICIALFIDIQEEIEMIQSRLDEERAVAGTSDVGIWAYTKGALREVAQPGVRNRMIIVFWMFIFQNFSGAAAISECERNTLNIEYELTPALASHRYRLLFSNSIRSSWSNGYQQHVIHRYLWSHQGNFQYHLLSLLHW